MAISTRPPWEEDEEQGFYEQSTATPASVWSGGATTTPGPKAPRPISSPIGAPQQGAAPKPLDYTTLVGGGQAAATSAQRHTAPPLADQGAAPTRINHNTYQPPGGGDPAAFFGQLQPGTPVQEAPGMVWQHDGQGWIQTASGAAPPWNPTQGGGPGGGGTNSDPRFSWMQSSAYTPGAIGTEDIPGGGWEDILRRMGPGYVPTNVGGGDFQSRDVEAEDFATYDFDGFSGLPGYEVGAVGEDVDALIRRIMANPDSLDALTVDKMKAASREEQSALQGQEDEELRAMGFDLGIEDSPWLRSERLDSRRTRDNAVIAGNRNIDIDAAKTNAGDRRAAATLGASYVDSKGRLKLAQRGQEFTEQAEGERNKQTSVASKQARAEYLTGVKGDNANRQLEAAKVRMQADMANNDNVFKAASLRKDSVLGAVDADLQRVAATTDRLALREQVGQAAAELGISRDKLMSDWLQALMDDATQRYGIDVAKDVDLKKLDQAGSEFKEDLAFRIMALKEEMGFKYTQLGESGRQFDYNLGLGYGNLYENARQHDDNMYGRSQGF